MMRRTCLLLALLVLAVEFAVSGGCGRAAVPSSYTPFTADDELFRCDAPTGWTQTGGGKNGNFIATFSSGGAEINVIVDVVGSVLADIDKNKTPGVDTDAHPELSPLFLAHERNGETMAKDLSGFKDLATIDIKMPIGEGKKSEFTGKGGLGSAQHGYRVTSLLTSQQLRVVCQCPESQWKVLKPVFDRVINSVTGR